MLSDEPPETGKGPPRVGSYRILKTLGTGGMSSVFHAMHAETGHEVAVKVLPRSLAKNPTLLHRFLREAKNAESLEHRNIASIYDRGVDQGRHYLVLEYVEGGDLHERVRNGGPLPIVDAVRAVRAVAEGLRYASGQGVIHRDVKPANLLMTPDGTVKIIDLGLALQTEAEDERVTRDGTTVGTVDYMAPEQARDSRATSERSDIYSLGCTFYFLLSGSPPYPGGDIVDKLGRHCTAPTPDVRTLRPDASESLALLVKKMMAKRPESRVQSYDALIALIDALPASRNADSPDGSTMDALIDDEEADLDVGLASVGPTSAIAPPEPRRPGLADRRREVETPAPLEVSLAELASLDADDRAPIPIGRRRPAPDESLLYDDVDETGGTIRSTAGELPLKTWVAAGAAMGLTIALLGYGAIELLKPRSTTFELVSVPESDPVGQGEEVPDRAVDPAPTVIRPGPTSTKTGGNPSSRPVTPTPPIVPAAWVEPGDRRAEVSPEIVYPADVEAEFLPVWARRPIPAVVDGPQIVVRRVAEPSEDRDLVTFRQALDRPSGVVEVADNGPFFEDDFQVKGKARLIRARGGFRPMIRIEPSSLGIIRDRAAVCLIDGADLILAGLDLVVDLRVMPTATTALFAVRGGGRITLHDCSVTVLGASPSRPFSLVRVEELPGDRPVVSTVRIENSFVRGTSGAMFDLPAAELVVRRSVLLHGTGGLVVQRATQSRGDRRVWVSRSVLASRGAAFEVTGEKTIPTRVRSLATTFAKVAGVDVSTLVQSRANLAAGAAPPVDWAGRDNVYVGWPGWLGAGERCEVLIKDLDEARRAWRSAEAGSRESNRAWPNTSVDEGTPTALRDLSDAPIAVLTRAASPSPSLLPSAVGLFARVPIPALPVVSLTAPPGPPPAIRIGDAIPRQGVGFEEDGRGSPRPGGAGRPEGGAGAGGDLNFDVADPAYGGDLGRYLAQKVSPGQTKVRVIVTGAGLVSMTPVRLADGVSLDLIGRGVNGAPPAFTPASNASAAALIRVVGGDLFVEGIGFVANPSARVARLIQVEDGHLLLARCGLQSGEGGPSDSGLVLFHAPGTRPLSPPRSGPFLSATDRPTCVLVDCSMKVGGGEAIAAELGRGALALTNCAVIAEGEGVAFALRPRKVALGRFEADLSLDRCSIAAEGDVVRIGPWPGTDPGPDRPWLVSTNRCAFMELARRGRRAAVLLRSVGEGLAHGSLSWQATGDGYEFAHFTATGSGPPPSPRLKPDVKARWVDFWGPTHVVGVVGPNPRRPEPALIPANRDGLRSGNATVEGLALDPQAHPDLGAIIQALPRLPGRSAWSSPF